MLWWVSGLTLIGTAVLWFSARARHNGLIWCIGASLNKLLPIIELNKEFTELFHDPERKYLRGWQIAYFSAQAVAGWVLGSFLVAALAGLTQRS